MGDSKVVEEITSSNVASGHTPEKEINNRARNQTPEYG